MMKKFLALAATIAALSACQAQTSAQEAEKDAVETPAKTAKACQDASYRQMDFWVGDWDLTWKNPDGTEAHGSNLITQDALGDCVITENFNGAPGNTLIGISHSTYSPRHQVWRQTWVDNQGGYFALTGGPQEDGTFILNMERLGDKGPFSRMVFEEIKPDSLVWRWQGKTLEADDWGDQWVINYARKS